MIFENIITYIFNIININNILIKNYLYTEESIYNLIIEQLDYFNNTYIPIRSYSNTFINTIHDSHLIKEKITYLSNVYQPEQRSNEWYSFRHNIVTASNAWKIFSNQSNFNQLVIEKCKPFDISKYDNVNIYSPMHHGIKYEPLSIMIYEQMYNTKVSDLDVQHKGFKFLGASPDG